ncbi:glycosyltransferase family 4 protein [Candidatus Daviesbacteria bacterium]|nr:glycosyltransferase family 4 protein [Candidatus Daviesbacteria bacterium]
MKKIIICSPQLGISPVSNLGGEIYDYQTIKGFTRRGVRVLIYLPKKRIYDKSIKDLSVTYSSMTHIFPPWFFSFICLPYLFKTYKREKFDILRIHSPRFLGIAAMIFHFFYPKVPILSSGVTVDSLGLHYLIERYIFNISSRIIVQSEYMKKLLVKKYHINQIKIAVTYGGVLDSSKNWVSRPKESVCIRNKDKVLLFMGALINRKNPLFALDIFIKVRSKLKNVFLVVIGEGNLKKKMKNKIKAKKMTDRIIFINSAYKEEKAYWFSRMDVFLFPSLNEGFGLVATEAMSFGKVVITSEKAAFKEIIDNGKDGFMLPLSNQKLWIDTTLKILSSSKISERIGRNALSKVKTKFSWERTYNLNKKVIEEMV